jgi:hypothetical protein
MDAASIIGDLTAVTKKWTRQRKAEERRESARGRREYVYSSRNHATEVLHEVIPPAYLEASTNGTLPAHARQIMYKARGPIQEWTREPLDDKYFTQVLLPNYTSDHPEETVDWDVVYDARGHFLEPHTNREVALGTLEVRQYLGLSRFLPTPGPVATRRCLYPTNGPTNRFGAVLFVEKEGFFPLFRAVRLAERYDLAIMSTKGMSVVAARHLIDEICGKHDIPLFVLHDFDKNGFSILGTLCGNNHRYRFKNRVRPIDLGLRLADVQAHGLTPESVHISNSQKARSNLKRHGATDEEIAFLIGSRQRVELNAFSSRQLVDWLEAKLKANGVKKVIPGADVLTSAYEEAFVRAFIAERAKEMEAEARERLKSVGVRADLHKQVAAAIKKTPAEPWDAVILDIATKAIDDKAEG